MLTLRLLSQGVPYLLHLLKLDILNRDLPLFHVRPLEYEYGYLYVMVLEAKGMYGSPFTESWYGIQTMSHDSPELLLGMETILLTVTAIIWCKIRLIHTCVSGMGGGYT